MTKVPCKRRSKLSLPILAAVSDCACGCSTSVCAWLVFVSGRCRAFSASMRSCSIWSVHWSWRSCCTAYLSSNSLSFVCHKCKQTVTSQRLNFTCMTWGRAPAVLRRHCGVRCRDLVRSDEAFLSPHLWTSTFEHFLGSSSQVLVPCPPAPWFSAETTTTTTTTMYINRKK